MTHPENQLHVEDAMNNTPPSLADLGYELEGVIADVEKSGGFDHVCLGTVKRVRNELAARGWRPGYPPADVVQAWLLIEEPDVDDSGGAKMRRYVVLGVWYEDEHDGEFWCRASDWHADDFDECVHEFGGDIVAWQPYEIPEVPK